MGLTLEDIAALRSGASDPIPVGELPHLIRLALGVRAPHVHLSRQSLEHINARHPDVTDYDLLLLPFTIQHGLILRERRKSNILLASYQQPMSQRRFVAVMKVTARQCEVWLDSFHRTKPRQTRRLLEKCEVLKRHD